MRSSLALFVPCVMAFAVSMNAQSFTPRDAFWSASDLVTVSSNPAKPGANAAAAPRTAPRTLHTGTSKTGAHMDPVLVAQSGYGAQPHLVRVSDQQLGLRYSLLQRDDAGKYSEVSTKAVFHAGDHVRLSVMANQPGYLYVVQRGSTGSWSPIFPAAGAENGSNKVEAGQLYQVPTGRGTWYFDQHAGEEKLFIILSRQPIGDLDSTIQHLGGSSGATPAQPAQPTPEEQTAPRSHMPVLEASNRIPDELVQRLASRDLVLAQEQQVDQSPKGGSTGEKAVYVVSKSSVAGAGPQVISQLVLRHE